MRKKDAPRSLIVAFDTSNSRNYEEKKNEKVQSETKDLRRCESEETSGTLASYEKLLPLRNYRWASCSYQENPSI
ncbi:MAG: hypothetical protein QG670_2481, partial [Thermoproteota archaeon]|nr:hypothetical protein [Thermoproteota archaeon]